MIPASIALPAAIALFFIAGLLVLLLAELAKLRAQIQTSTDQIAAELDEHFKRAIPMLKSTKEVQRWS